jgi:hypothetical protein
MERVALFIFLLDYSEAVNIFDRLLRALCECIEPPESFQIPLKYQHLSPIIELHFVNI